MLHVDDGTLNALLDGELAESEARLAEAHLAACTDCRERFEEARSFLAEAGELLSLLAPAGEATPAPEAALPPRRVAATSREKALDLDGGTQKSPAARPLFPQGDRRVSTTQKERAIDLPTGQSPAIDLPTGVSPALPGDLGERSARVLPLRRRGFDAERMAWAASLVLALGLGYFTYEILHSRTVIANSAAADSARAVMEVAAAPAATTGTQAPPAAGSGAPGRSRQLTRPAGARGDKPPTADAAGDAALRGAGRTRPAERPGDLAGAAGGSGRTENPVAGPPAAAATPLGAARLEEATPPVTALQQPRAMRDAASRQPTGEAPAQRAAAPVPGQASGSDQNVPASFRRISSDEAIRRLSGSIRLVDGMEPDRFELGAGRLVPGSDPDRDVIRVVYSDPRGRRLTLDQQPGNVRPDSSMLSVNGLMRGDTLMTAGTDGGLRIRWVDRKNFWLSLSGTLPADSMRVLLERIR